MEQKQQTKVISQDFLIEQGYKPSTTIKEVKAEEMFPSKIINETPKKDLKFLKITVWTIIGLCLLYLIGKFIFGKVFI